MNTKGIKIRKKRTFYTWVNNASPPVKRNSAMRVLMRMT